MIRLGRALAVVVLMASGSTLHGRQRVTVSFQCKGREATGICSDKVKVANDIEALDKAVVDKIRAILQQKYDFFDFGYAPVGRDDEALCSHLRLVLTWAAKTKEPKLDLEVYRWMASCKRQDYAFSEELTLDLADSSKNPGTDSWPEIVEAAFANYLRPLKTKAAVLQVIPLGDKASLYRTLPDADQPQPNDVLAFLPISDQRFLKEHFNELFLIKYRSERYGDQELRVTGLSCTEFGRQLGLIVRADEFLERGQDIREIRREIPYEPKGEHRDRIGALADNTFFLYLTAAPRSHGENCPKYRTDAAVDTGGF